MGWEEAIVSLLLPPSSAGPLTINIYMGELAVEAK